MNQVEHNLTFIYNTCSFSYTRIDFQWTSPIENIFEVNDESKTFDICLSYT